MIWWSCFQILWLVYNHFVPPSLNWGFTTLYCTCTFYALQNDFIVQKLEKIFHTNNDIFENVWIIVRSCSHVCVVIFRHLYKKEKENNSFMGRNNIMSKLTFVMSQKIVHMQFWVNKMENLTTKQIFQNNKPCILFYMHVANLWFWFHISYIVMTHRLVYLK